MARLRRHTARITIRSIITPALPTHTICRRPTSDTIGETDQANHQYDLSWFQTAALAGKLPAVSYLKANRAQDGHPNNSSPLDEQDFIVSTINFLESLPDLELPRR